MNPPIWAIASDSTVRLGSEVLTTPAQHSQRQSQLRVSSETFPRTAQQGERMLSGVVSQQLGEQKAQERYLLESNKEGFAVGMRPGKRPSP